jgi:hypothetical protein
MLRVFCEGSRPPALQRFGLAEESFLASVGSHPCREESASTMGRPAFIFIRLEKVG